MRHVHTRTDFSQFSHQQLIGMLASSDPATIRSAAARWDSTGRLLQDQAAALQQKLADFQDKWQGKAAQQYQQMITELANGLRTVGNTALSVRDASFDAADALDTARAQMPAPVAVPEVPPATVAMASAPAQLEGLTQPQASQVIQQQTAATVAVQNQQQAQTVADGAHAQAVQVMTTLANHYTADDDAIPDVPDAGVAPQSDASGTGSSAVAPTLASPGAIGSGVAPGVDASGLGTGVATDAVGDPAAGNSALAVPGSPADLTNAAAHNPLFGTMFANGIAAAGGAFPLARVPTLIRRHDRKSPGSDANAASKAAAVGAAAAANKIAGGGGGGAGGIGGGGASGGVSIGGGGGGGSVGSAGAAQAPSGYAGLAGASGAGGAGSMAGLTGPVGGAAGSAASSGGFMGGMPMGGAGMGGMGMDGGGRRIPPWLVETEDVWGESSAVAPTVIGEEL